MDWYCGVGYAPIRHTPGKRPYGDISQRYCSARIVLCGRKQSYQYPTAPSIRNCCRQSKRCLFWTPTQAFTWKLPPPIPTMEKSPEQPLQSCVGYRFQLSVIVRRFTKKSICCKLVFLQECVPFCKCSLSIIPLIIAQRIIGFHKKQVLFLYFSSTSQNFHSY